MAEKTDSYIPFFGRDFLAATMGWPDAAVGTYIRLLIVQWEQGSLPGDVGDLAAIAPTVAEHWRRLEPKFPPGEDGTRRNLRLEEHRARANELKAARSEAGRLGNLRRWSDRKAIANRSQTVSQTVSQTDRKPIANGIAKRSPPSPSPSPVSSSLRSEDKNSSLRSESAPTETPAARRSRSRPSDPIAWSPADGWRGITDDDRAAWRTAYPAVDVARQLAAMGEWLKANPDKARKSRWRAFVVRWLSREQDRGGSAPSNRPAGRHGESPMTLDEKLERDRRESRRKPKWRDAPAGCPDDLAGLYFNQMLNDDQFEANYHTARRIHSQRLQEAARRPNDAEADTGDGPATIGRLIASQGHPRARPEIDETEDVGEHEYDPIRDGWVGKDGRP